MKCIARVATQTYDDEGHVRTFRKGEVFEFKECPVNFESLDESELNFEEASLEQLMETDWEKEDIVDFAKENYDADISRYRKKESLAEAFVDARYRNI